MHAATPFTLYRRRFAGLAGTGFGTTALAGQHRNRIAYVCFGHLPNLRLTGGTLRED
jgi:hypothetical protein